MEDTVIPGPFNYHRPATVADAIKLLSTLGDDARPLAGGHSLVPMMKLRLATPEHLVDLHGIDGLKGIQRDGEHMREQWLAWMAEEDAYIQRERRERADVIVPGTRLL